MLNQMIVFIIKNYSFYNNKFNYMVFTVIILVLLFK